MLLASIAIAIAVVGLGAHAVLVLPVRLVNPVQTNSGNRHLGITTAVGGWVRSRCRRPSDRESDRFVGRLIVVIGVFVVVLPIVAPLLLVGAFPVSVAAKRRRRLQRERTVAADLPDLVDLYAVGVQAGLGSSAILEIVARQLPGVVADEVIRTVRLHRLGRSWREVLPELTERLGPQSRPFIDAFDAYETQGVAIGDSLTEISAALRDDQRRHAETVARRLPVQMLFPLIVCVLPAFLVLTVAPIIVDAFAALS